MSKFRVGDKVRRVKDNYCGMEVGDEDTVVAVKDTSVELKRNGNGHSPSSLEIVEDTSKHHVHREAIIAWANGAEIEYKLQPISKWLPSSAPSFRKEFLYRIKPEETSNQRKIREALETIEELKKQVEELSNER